ncbi:2-keto-4-pentenoate hydratase/2-oxohepta-3-ene-1,7-dioic acid hydratase in catechol pathway [Kineosphaera limosa]|uniref:Fumarylacetoacetate hydrolase family protein n=1 Tax=Kineosphaera limosa NBRC 100340 TaxID=1184609 RepID=K6W873_9MICO|nr:fumarylacetoacetate hydrolase family protein [Kineosphaera limosa]NYE00999.1 2-keto-4-pentenoate hydratase/2-oxohepta-3-ene-1,7-dioic acid hydratase in catechol pathway [Kineosphaera limosa]GAB95385.1 fumarylacetoacetate hydrolase family protein [Kineosphaera limosa NBRC 100340]
MRIATSAGRAVLLVGEHADHAVDLAEVSDGRFGPDPEAVYEQWQAFVQWGAQATLPEGAPVEVSRLGPPVPAPRQIFGIGLNYRDHAQEAGLDIPTELLVFTKFPSCLTGPDAQVRLPSDRVDWEVELVVVIGREALAVSPEQAWEHVAGLTIGQDLSERRVQFAVKPPQFSLGKSYPGFGPTGPAVVTADELPDKNALAIGCTIDGEVMQDGTTADFIFDVAAVVSGLSQVVRLLPGDLIFTGTPAGVGSVRQPRRYLAPGETIVSTIKGLGSITTRLV